MIVGLCATVSNYIKRPQYKHTYKHGRIRWEDESTTFPSRSQWKTVYHAAVPSQKISKYQAFKPTGPQNTRERNYKTLGREQCVHHVKTWLGSLVPGPQPTQSSWLPLDRKALTDLLWMARWRVSRWVSLSVIHSRYKWSGILRPSVNRLKIVDFTKLVLTFLWWLSLAVSVSLFPNVLVR